MKKVSRICHTTINWNICEYSNDIYFHSSLQLLPSFSNLMVPLHQYIFPSWYIGITKSWDCIHWYLELDCFIIHTGATDIGNHLRKIKFIKLCYVKALPSWPLTAIFKLLKMNNRFNMHYDVETNFWDHGIHYTSKEYAFHCREYINNKSELYWKHFMPNWAMKASSL